MEIVFVIIAISVFIITINLSIKASVSYDFVKNIGYISIRLFKLQLFYSEVSLIAGYFNLIRKNKKVIQIKFDINDKNFKFVEDISTYVIKKIHLVKLNSQFDLKGLDPSQISILAGYVLVVEGVLRSVIQSKYPDALVDSDMKTGYYENKLKFIINLNILITLFDFLWAILRAFIKRSMYGKTTKLRRNS